MMNGQLKPGYNLQHIVNSGFIAMVGIFSNPGDFLTQKAFVEQISQSLALGFKGIVCYKGYESEEKLKHLEDEGIEAFIKPTSYE